ncbi:methyltransferase domain-containing protein [Amycolatopsis sp. NPDC051061]|uniref:methyltransferase domain-containing protein n=1 Tax=Amycolatopsis sp. NPDC051061 TaxID=3155042 RepID=UPI00342811BE
MLETLDIHDNHRVLEIGTGTGYNAGLLCHRLSATQVFSVDIGTDLVTAARERLAALAYTPMLATTDGTGGLPDHCSYDRIIATCSVPEIPWSWAEQLRPGGLLLVGPKRTIHAGNLVLLERYSDRLERPLSPDMGHLYGHPEHSCGTRQHSPTDIRDLAPPDTTSRNRAATPNTPYSPTRGTTIGTSVEQLKSALEQGPDRLTAAKAKWHSARRR